LIVQGQAIGDWVAKKASGNWTHLCSAIGQIKDEEIIAGVMYDNYTGSSICIHSRIDEPKLVSRKFYWAVFDYPFNKLKVKRLTGVVPLSNLNAQKLNEHLGFKKEAILKDYFPSGDAIIYVMRQEDCRFLRLGAKYEK
jgi:hypothetical protein